MSYIFIKQLNGALYVSIYDDNQYAHNEHNIEPWEVGQLLGGN